MYVLNSDNATASIRGFYVSAQCTLTQIPGSDRPLPSQGGRAGHGPVRRARAVPGRVGAVRTWTGRPRVTVTSSSTGSTRRCHDHSDGQPDGPDHRTPYGLDYNSKSDILSVTHEQVDAPPFPNSKVATYRQLDDGTLVRLDSEPSPGAACWNLFTENGKFLFVTNPAGQLRAPGTCGPTRSIATVR